MTEFQFADEIERALIKHNKEKLIEEYWCQDEFLYVQNFLPPAIVSALQQEIPNLQCYTHRASIPGVRKGGSVGATNLRNHTALIKEIYSSTSFIEFLTSIVKRPLLLCPADDEHAMAFYSYTEEGDFIHYHYDTSFYKGNRYTVLLTIENNSSCNLMYDLYKKSNRRSADHHEVSTAAGSLVVFNGNKLYHAVSPALKGEQRHVLSLEYVDNTNIGAFGKLISEVKDRVGYFGLSPHKKNVTT